ncbi:MAG: serine/threonine protein kinase [Anaerolineae bacterium]|jgi:hypothetical protein|nr:serine/threonine protein kinase [Anaerolineae bacterium]
MAATDPTTGSQTRVTLSTTRIERPTQRRIVRVVWLLVVAVSIGFGIANIVTFTAGRLVPCEASPCGVMQLSPASVAEYERSGVPFAVAALLRPILEIIAATTYISVGLLIFRRRSDDWIGLLTSAMLCLLGFRLTGVASTLSNTDPAMTPLSLMLTSLMFISAYGTLYLFPNGRFVPRWAFIPLAVTLVYEILRGIAINFPILQINPGVMQFGSVILAGIGLYCQGVRYRQLTPVERQQLKWVLLATGMLIGGILVSAINIVVVPSMEGVAYVVVSLVLLVVQYLLYLGLPLAFAFSMLRYRLWEADLAINRTLVYAASTILLAVVFFVLFFALRAGLVGLIGTDSTIPLVVSTAVAAGLFNPVRARLARVVDRQVYGLRVELRDLRKHHAHETHFVPLREADTGQHSRKTIAGYLLGGVLGKGGMGEVYAAQHPDIGAAAVKILPPELAAQPEPLARFQREADILSRLNHPNIVRTFGAGMSDGLHYLAMELVDGSTLSDRLKRSVPPNLNEAAALIRDIAAGLDAAHAADVVHRDVKASNILLRPTDEGVEAVVTDFGIAKLASEQTSALTKSNLIGTLDTIAPEQIMASHEVDHRADIYALALSPTSFSRDDTPLMSRRQRCCSPTSTSRPTTRVNCAPT